jgi:predicted RNA binding protein YcfA (HicA-like mRNA interferase family)
LSRTFSSREILAVLRRAGFQEVSRKGSHVKLRRRTSDTTLVVIVKHPAREYPEGTFASILKQARMSRDQFEHLL